MKNTKTNGEAARQFNAPKWFVVLLDNHNELVSWKGYETISTASSAFFYLFKEMNECTDGSFSLVEGDYPTFADEDGNKVVLTPSTPELTIRIIFDTKSLVREMFHDMVRRDECTEA